jgi:hypothetical protein
VNERKDHYARPVDLVDQSIAVYEKLADVGVANFRDDSPSLAQRCE